jgi:hypothetical protein
MSARVIAGRIRSMLLRLRGARVGAKMSVGKRGVVRAGVPARVIGERA